MSELDWTFLGDGLDAGTVDRGVTAGIARPSGGGSFLFGFNSLQLVEGAVGLKASPAGSTNFDPLLKGGSIRGCVKRGASPGNTGWSPFLFIGLQGNSVLDNAYMLGLSDDDPYRITLRKSDGGIVTGIPATDDQNLRQSTASFQIADDLWHHLRLDMVVNLNGDVVLKVFQNDLSANPIGSAPVWTAVAGMTDFIDDALGINTGSQPFTDGRVGFAHAVSDSQRRSYFDHLEALKQL